MSYVQPLQYLSRLPYDVQNLLNHYTNHEIYTDFIKLFNIVFSKVCRDRSKEGMKYIMNLISRILAFLPHYMIEINDHASMALYCTLALNIETLIVPKHIHQLITSEIFLQLTAYTGFKPIVLGELNRVLHKYNCFICDCYLPVHGAMSSKTMVVQVHSFDVSYNPCKYKMPAFILKDSNSSKIESIIKEFRDDSNNEIKEVNTVVE